MRTQTVGKGFLAAVSAVTAIALSSVLVSFLAPFARAEVIADSLPPLPANLIKVPLVRQATNYTCGVAALQAVLGFYGEDFREDELARKLCASKKNGTRYARMARFARERGYSVAVQADLTIASLQKSVDCQQPVIVLIQAWPESKRLPIKWGDDWKDGHYMVLVGYDTTNLFFMDPATLGSYTYIPINEFTDRWHDVDGKERLHNFGMTLKSPATGTQTDGQSCFKAKKLD